MKLPKFLSSVKTDRPSTITIPLPSKEAATPVLIVCLIIASFLLGMMTTKIQYLEKDGSPTVTAGTTETTGQTPPAAPPDETTPRVVAMDDDAILGDKNAPVTMIEFSDYECPFCKKYFDETYAKIKADYVDTGKVKIVFRDLPLSFHANAHKQAEAAECVRSLTDDATYFKYHDAIFTKTTSGGTGLALTELAPMASLLGLDQSAVQSCIDGGKFAAEVDKDLADATTVGANATPSFFIGKSDRSGKITGTPIIGAYPYENFKTLIDGLL